MNVVFLGGKSVGYGILNHLILTDKVIGIFTNPSDIEAFEKPTWFPSIYPLAKKNNINYYIESVNKSQFFDNLDKDIDWIVCAYYDRIVSDNIISIPKRGIINIHMGLSDQYRGCYPTTFPIIDGKDRAGITIHDITSDVDGGDVYLKSDVSVDPSDTGKTLYYKCAGAAISSFIKFWDSIKKGVLKPQKQIKNKNTVYHKRKDFPSLDLSDLTLDKINKYGRALTFPPFPRPFYVINGKKYEINYA